MSITNYGNKYKFEAIMKNRQGHTPTVWIQPMRKDGKWGKAFETERMTASAVVDGTFKTDWETDEQVVERFIRNNNREYRIAE